jgi:hypothetical protein
MHGSLSPITAIAMPVVIRLPVVKEKLMLRAAHSAPKEVAHGSLLFAEAIRSRRGLLAWAPYLTLMKC